MYRKKLVTKILSIALAVCMITSVVPMDTYAATVDTSIEDSTETAVNEEAEDTSEETAEEENSENEDTSSEEETGEEDSEEIADEETAEDTEESIEETEFGDKLDGDSETIENEDELIEDEFADEALDAVDSKYKEYFGHANMWVNITPKDGNNLVFIKGEFVGVKSGTSALEEAIEKIRKDAVASGLKNPDSVGGSKLADGCYSHRNTYKMKYSSGLEAIAKQRAVEVALSNNYTNRPNGDKGNMDASKYTLDSVLFSTLAATNSIETVKSRGEIRVLIDGNSTDPITDALNFVKNKKSTYKSATNHLSDTVRDYYNLIRPWHASFGAAAFKIENANKYVVVFEFGYHKTGIASNAMDPANGKYDVEPYKEQSTASDIDRAEGYKVEIAKAAVKGYDLGGIDDVVYPGTVGKFYKGLKYTLVNCVNGNNNHVSGIYGTSLIPKADNSLISINGTTGAYTVGSSEGTCTLTYGIEIDGKTTTYTKKVEIIKEENCLKLTKPTKLEYIVGQDSGIDLTGGYVQIMTSEDPDHKQIKLTTANTTPKVKADFSEPGTYTYVVTVGKYTAEFDIVVKDPPVKEKQIFGGLPSITLVPGKDNALTYVKGGFVPVSNIEKLENRTYDIRFDATKSALPNPQSATATRLLSPTYRDRGTWTLKYSAEMEALARQRAIECSLYFVDGSTVRPNGDKVLTNLKCYNGVSYVGIKDEIKVSVPATSKDPINDAINTVLKQKASYNKDTYLGYSVKDFRALIDPLNTCIGAAAFKMEGSDYYCVVIEIGAKKTGRVAGKDKITPETPDVEAWPSHYASSLITVEKGFPVEIAKSYYGGEYIVTGIRDAVQPLSKGIVTCGVNYTIPNCIMKGKNTHSGEIAGMEFVVQPGAEEYISIDANGKYQTTSKVGTFTLSIKVGDKTTSKKIQIIKNEDALDFTPPTKRVFCIGEALDFSSGKVRDKTICNPKNETLTLDSVNTTPKTEVKNTGVYTFVTRVGDFTREFDVLLIKPLEINVNYDDDINSVLPSDENGYYELSASELEKIKAVGKYELKATYTPNDSRFNVKNDVPAVVNVTREFDESDTDIELLFNDDSFIYCGYAINPLFSVKIGNTILKLNEDYTITYGDSEHDNTTADSSVKHGLITIKGKGYYSGSYKYEFNIQPIPLVITGKNYTFGKNTDISILPELITTSSGLLADHSIVFDGAEVTCDYIQGGELVLGEFDVDPIAENITVVDLKKNDVTSNYNIITVAGKVKVVPDLISYEVTFVNPFEAENLVVSVSAGSTVDAPFVDDVSSYEFKGWYKDSAYKTAWNFDSDLVQNDMNLYARWVKTSATDFRVEQIADQMYTGGRITPKFAVYDEDTLLTINKDYVLTYYNNINVNNTKASDEYNSLIPYVTITGRGNYTGSVNVNFNIVRVPLGDGVNADSNVVLNCKDFYYKSAVAQKTVSAVRYKKNLTPGTDYTVVVLANKAYNNKREYVAKGSICENAMIPANWYGSFDIVVEGSGNYTGSFVKTVTVSDPLRCMNRAAVVIDAKYKNVDYTGKNIELPSAAVIVKIGTTVLKYGKDYTFEYINNDKVGVATLKVNGIGDYWGFRNATFTIKGKAFNNRTVASLAGTAYAYTGKPVLVNNAKLIYTNTNGTKDTLVPGVDYSVSYSNNIKKGTATATYIGKESAGYTGKYVFRYTIGAADISDSKLVDKSSLDSITSGKYSVAGATINDQIELYNIGSGLKLIEGTDYTVIYTKNRVMSDVKATASIRGKGNYAGILTKNFEIEEKSVLDSSITVQITPIAFNPASRLSTVYKPSVVVKDGKTNVARTYISAEFFKCDQESVANYFNGGDVPYVKLTGVTGKGYSGSIMIEIPFYKLATKLTSANTYIVVDQTVYNNGAECMPSVKVYYSTNTTAITTVKRNKLYKDEDIKSVLGEDSLLTSDQYYLTWKSNIFAGANRGTVIVTGLAPDFGGSVSTRFTISAKEFSF